MKLHLVPKKIIEFVVFNVRWLLLLFIFKLIGTILSLFYVFCVRGGLPNEALVSTLEALDVVMIAALIEMVITGIYNSHIDKNHGYPNKNITSGVLKIKMGTSLICASSIHLLKVFVETEAQPTTLQQQLIMAAFWMKIIIHLAFIVGGIALAWIDRVHVKTEAQELENEEKEHEIEERHHKNQHNEKDHSPVSGHGISGTA